MKRIKILSALVLTITLLVVGCKGTKTETPAEPSFVSKTTYVDTAYPPIDPAAQEIMEKLQICTLSDTVLTLPPCDAKYFRVFQYQTEGKWRDGFIVEMIPGLYGAPVHQVVIIDNYFGKYRIINQYLGSLLELRTTENGHSDLLIAYSDPDIGKVAIRHEWQGEKYDIVDVEEINNHFVKPELKDSINSIFLPAFAAGH